MRKHLQTFKKVILSGPEVVPLELDQLVTQHTGKDELFIPFFMLRFLIYTTELSESLI